MLVNSDFTVNKIQKYLSKLVDKTIYNLIFKPLLRTKGRAYNARYRSTCGPHAGAFLRALPKKNMNTLLCDEFSTACILRLGLPFPFITPDAHCDCKSKALIGIYGQHLHTCNKDNTITNKHNELTKVIEQLCSHAGIGYVHEPLNCFPTDKVGNIHPDIKIIQPRLLKGCNDSYLVDVSVIHAVNKTSITQYKSDKKTGISARKREIDKNTAYLQYSNNHNLHFVPAAFETHGTWGEDFTILFEGLINKIWVRNKQQISLAIIREYWTKRISVIHRCIRGNAQMLLGRTAKIYEGFSFRFDDAYRRDNVRDGRVLL